MGIQQRQSNRAAMDPLYNSLSIALPSQHARMQLNCPGHALLCYSLLNLSPFGMVLHLLQKPICPIVMVKQHYMQMSHYF
jgi:hypothetical protein